MTTTSATRNVRRFSAAEQAFTDAQNALKAYLNDRLPHTDWRRTEQLVCETWLEALSAEDEADGVDGQEEGLQVWLTAAARRVIGRHTHPVPRDVRWELLTQVLGHTSTWPERWHQALVREGQAGLLKTAAADLAPEEEEQQQPEPERERGAGSVVPLPSAMPRRYPRPAAMAA